MADLEDGYYSAIEANDNQRARAVAVELTARIAKEVTRLSINAPNWYDPIALNPNLYSKFRGYP